MNTLGMNKKLICRLVNCPQLRARKCITILRFAQSILLHTGNKCYEVKTEKSEKACSPRDCLIVLNSDMTINLRVSFAYQLEE